MSAATKAKAEEIRAALIWDLRTNGTHCAVCKTLGIICEHSRSKNECERIIINYALEKGATK